MLHTDACFYSKCCYFTCFCCSEPGILEVCWECCLHTVTRSLSSRLGSYAVADNSYRSLRTERKDQCILISGESGAGKTEASKKILQYYAVTCPASEQVQTVKDRLLQSNPVLEVSLICLLPSWLLV